MSEQRYVLKSVSSFEPRDIFECGQCFRWNVQEDGSYIGVFGNNVLSVKKVDDEFVFTGVCDR